MSDWKKWIRTAKKEQGLKFSIETKDYMKDVKKFLRNLDINTPTMMNAMGRQLAEKLLQLTPIARIETAGYIGGRAKGGWFAAVKGLGGSPTIRFKHNPTHVAQGESEGWLKLTYVNSGRYMIEMGNDVPYMPMLELGWSNQAPQGILRVAIQALTLKIQSSVNRLMTHGKL